MSTELERFDLSQIRGRIAYEHLHRYALCREWVAGKRVLDLACGSGYGSAILAQAGADVTAVDINAKAIKDAKRRYGKSGAKYFVADCFDLPFDDGEFDLIVANEMIEHVEDHDGLLGEAKRVLRDGGIMLVSTPNKPVYNRYKPPNAFHVSELEVDEFRRLLSKHFKQVHFTGTRMALVSVGFNMEVGESKGNLAAARIYRSVVDNEALPSIENDELWLGDVEYVLAACSDAPLEISTVSSSLLYSREDDLWLEHEKIMAWASQLHDEDEELRSKVARAVQDLEDAKAALARSETDKAAIGDRLEDIKRASEAANTALELYRSSVEREATSLSDVVTRLLGRMVGTPVAGDLASIAEALMQLGGEIELRRMQVAELGDLKSRLDQSESQKAGLETDLRNANVDNAALQRELDANRAHLDEERKVRTNFERASAIQLETLTQRLVELDAASSLRDKQYASDVEAIKLQLAESNAAIESTEKRRADETEALLQQLEYIRSKSSQIVEELTSKSEDLSQQILRMQIESAEREALLRNEAESARKSLSIAESKLPDHNVQRLPEPVALREEIQYSEKLIEPFDQERTESLEKFKKTHRRVRAAIAHSPYSLKGRLPPHQVSSSPNSRKWKRLLGLSPEPLDTAIFDAAWIERQAPEFRGIKLATYLKNPRCGQIDPHPLFDAKRYLANNFDVEASGISPLLHYVKHGWREGRSPHVLFANDWYLDQNPDILASGRINPLDHYLQFGWREGRWPNPLFDPRAYLDRYPDVDQAGMEPLTHFVAFGQFEGREVQSRAIDTNWQRFVPSNVTGSSLMEHLLSTDPEADEEAHAHPQSNLISADWPPKPLNDYWLPQGTRDFIIDQFGAEALELFWYLYSVMAGFREDPDAFPASRACSVLLERARTRSRARADAANTTCDASIIIPVYNNILDTLLCVVSLLELADERSFEIIVADDGSSDATPQTITAIGGVVRYVRQPSNLGFLGNCNEAAKHSNGRVIVLLNNDTIVLPNWLDGLLAPFDDFEQVGLTGSKLINWDGTLQEAGGIFWKDGSAWNFGRNQDATAPEFSYLKDVDYCSGASIAIPVDIWQEMGGFDPLYTPAYCEDSDLAFRLRGAGYRTLFTPASQVIHHEGRSHGRDLNSGIKAYQVTNQKRLLERWKAVLESDHFPNGENVLRARDRSFAKPHVLVIDHYVPQWDQDAGSRTIYQYMQALIDDGCQVTFWPDNLWRDPRYTPLLQDLGIEVIYGPKFRNGFEDFIQQRADLYDAVFLSRPHVAEQYIPAIRKHTNARILYYGHDLHFRRMEAGRAIGDRVLPEEIDSMRELEFKVCRGSDVIFYPDPEEVRFVEGVIGGDRKFAANPVFLFGDGEIETGRHRIAAIGGNKANKLLFIGGFSHSPNREGIIWFATEVFPIIKNRVPGVSLEIVGSKPPIDVLNLEAEDIAVVGYVSDERLDTMYSLASVAIAPLRYGAGVKGKVIEAMANGIPVAATPTGAQGISTDYPAMFIGETAADFAEAVIEALTDRVEAERRANSALAFIEQNYSRRALQSLLQSSIAS